MENMQFITDKMDHRLYIAERTKKLVFSMPNRLKEVKKMNEYAAI